LSSPLSTSPLGGCGYSSGETKEVWLNAAALASTDSLILRIAFPNSIVLFSALVDSGSTHCFVDPSFISKYNRSTYDIAPVSLRLLDGSVGSLITRAADISIVFCTGDELLMKFFVTPLDSSVAFVFGYDWLRRFNPLIDWSDSRLLSFRSLAPSASSSALPSAAIPDVPLVTSTPSASSAPLNTPLSSSSSSFNSFSSSSAKSASVSDDTEHSAPPSVSFINAAAYARLARVADNQFFTISVSNADSAKAFGAAVEPVDLSKIPEEYHEFQDIFSKSKASTLPPHRPYDLKIDLEDGASPPLGRMYALSEIEKEALRKFLDENLSNGFIRQSNSPHGAPILFFKKKDGSLQLCVDFRGLNKISRKDRYPLPLISDLLDSPGKARIYTKIDLRHAYHLVRIRDGNEPKTDFRTKWGSFEWLVMPEGLSNAPAAFQRFMNDIFADMLDVCVVVYLDDILIYSSDMSTHRKQVKEVLRRLRQHGLYAKPEKCSFHQDRVEFLGYILSAQGLTMASDKVQVIRDWPEPRKVKDVQSFLGFANFYRRFIHNFSDITIPLTRLTRKSAAFVFGDRERSAFEALKEAFCTAPVLTHWVPDRPITIETDASDYALAAILSITLDSGEIHPVAFHSRSFNSTEMNYDTHDKELYAIFEAFRIWRHYLDGAALPIDVVTDHKNLEYFATTKVLNRRQARWSEYLCQFNLVI
jgi:hypothetical protein